LLDGFSLIKLPCLQIVSRFLDVPIAAGLAPIRDRDKQSIFAGVLAGRPDALDAAIAA
jgi:hypothetical protein